MVPNHVISSKTNPTNQYHKERIEIN